jgi:hypothetical protein
MEKGYRDYGHDIDNTDSVLEAGLGFAVDLDKPGGFIGRDAVLAKKAEGPLTRRLVQVLGVNDPEPLHVPRRGGAPRRQARRLRARRVVRLFTLGGAVGLAMVDVRRAGTRAWPPSRRRRPAAPDRRHARGLMPGSQETHPACSRTRTWAQRGRMHGSTARRRGTGAALCPLRPGDPCTLCHPEAMAGPQDCPTVALVMDDPELRAEAARLRSEALLRRAGDDGARRTSVTV